MKTAWLISMMVLLSGCKNIAVYDGTPNSQQMAAVAIDVENLIPSVHMSRFDDEIGAEREVLKDCANRVRPEPSCRLAGRCGSRGYSAVALGAKGGVTFGIGCGFPTPIEANQAAVKACKGPLPWFGSDCEVKTTWSQQ